MNERIIALDIGDARIGVAVSDASRLIATPIDTIYRVGYGPDVRKVVDTARGLEGLKRQWGVHAAGAGRQASGGARVAGSSRASEVLVSMARSSR